MAIAYSNIIVELREISLKNRPQELYQISKKVTVPVLITIENLVIDESLDIMMWAISNKQKNKLYKYNQIIDLITINDTIFKKWLDKYKYNNKENDKNWFFYRDKCSEILCKYEDILDRSKFLINDELGLVDIAIFPFIRQFANVDIIWFKDIYTNLNKWLENIIISKEFNSVMKKYNIWNNTDSPLIVDFNKIEN